MAAVKHERIWKLLNEYKFNFHCQLTDEFFCNICKTILKNPCQSPCGCRYCKDCVLVYLNDKEKPCPGTGDDCKEQLIDFSRDLQLDYAINKKIFLVKVECPKPDCKFVDELRNMDIHINSHTETCPYFNIGCHFPDTQMPFLVDHIKSDHYEHGKLLVESFANLKNEVASLNLSMKLAKEDSEKKNNQLIEMENKLNDLKASYSKKIEKLNESITELKVKNDELKSSATQNENQIKNESENSKITEIEDCETIEDIPRYSGTTYANYAPFKWKISQFKNKQMYRYKNTNITSDPFYSAFHGYKFCLSVYPNGTGCGFSTHLSVFIHIMKGEYDDSLYWPMKLNIRICLVDQMFGNIYIDKSFQSEFVSLNQQNMFDRPTDYQNMGIGDAKFISIDALFKNERIYANDSIILRCFVR